jgi:hypothetical protein
VAIDAWNNDVAKDPLPFARELQASLTAASLE